MIVQPRAGIPVKEGLRRRSRLVNAITRVPRAGIPVKEGLRLDALRVINQLNTAPSGYSSKRRIKTVLLVYH